jgi:hypothetical protein
VYGEEPEFSEELLSGGGIGGYGHAGAAKKVKSSGDSSSTSPERSRRDDAFDGDKRHPDVHHESSCGPTPTAGYGNRKPLAKKPAAASGSEERTKAAPSPSPMLKYLKIRVSVLHNLRMYIHTYVQKVTYVCT